MNHRHTFFQLTKLRINIDIALGRFLFFTLRNVKYSLFIIICFSALRCDNDNSEKHEKAIGVGLKKPVAEFYENGSLRVEGFEDEKGSRTGLWKYYYPDGTLWSLGEFRAGKRHGRSTVYFENGNLRYSGQYEMDQKTGEWAFYDSTGKKIEDKRY
jgi:hypothetical protein